MAKGYETREFVMPIGRALKAEEAYVRQIMLGKTFLREDFIKVKAMIVRSRPGYLKKGGEPYDEQEAGMAFATCLKDGSIRELKPLDKTV